VTNRSVVPRCLNYLDRRKKYIYKQMFKVKDVSLFNTKNVTKKFKKIEKEKGVCKTKLVAEGRTYNDIPRCLFNNRINSKFFLN
jgi:hypothetical protein